MAFNSGRSPRTIYGKSAGGLSAGLRASPRTSGGVSAGLLGYGSDRDSVTGRSRKVKARYAIIVFSVYFVGPSVDIFRNRTHNALNTYEMCADILVTNADMINGYVLIA